MKRISKTLFAILFISLNHLIFAQQYVREVTHIDQSLTDSLISSLRNQKVDTVFLFLTTLDGTDFTYLFWLKERDTYIMRITDSTVSKEIEIDIPLLNDNIPFLAIQEAEDQLLFKPPIVHSEQCDVFILFTIKGNFIIESGDCSNFILDKSKSKLRKQFMSDLKQKIFNSNIDWGTDFFYERDF